MTPLWVGFIHRCVPMLASKCLNFSPIVYFTKWVYCECCQVIRFDDGNVPGFRFILVHTSTFMGSGATLVCQGDCELDGGIYRREGMANVGGSLVVSCLS